MNPRILIVEDQEDIASLISLNLKILNFEVNIIHDGQEGLSRGLQTPYDVIILDIMLPSLDGLSICKALREANIQTPLLMLTARQSETDRVTGLELGADDYLTKPFSVLELQARVKALLRRAAINTPAESTAQLIKIKDLTIDPLKRLVQFEQQELQLTTKEFDLLLFLAKAPGQVFSREHLLNEVWGYNHSGYEHTVNSHINRLRSKLEKDSANPEYVLTVWGVGYKLNDK
ncbi:MAG: response regulator transcription factor [Pseudomonadota bacterium]|nr:response regulator transcription factor [Pseudomonadota bacterium]